MTNDSVIQFMKTSELYLKMTEQQRNAPNINKIAALMFRKNSASDKAYSNNS